MNRTSQPNQIVVLLGMLSVLFLISYFPLPFPLQLCGFIAVPLWFLGLKRGGQTLLIASPLFVAWINLAYLVVSPRAAGGFVIAYMLALLMVVVFDAGRLLPSVRRFIGVS